MNKKDIACKVENVEFQIAHLGWATGSPPIPGRSWLPPVAHPPRPTATLPPVSTDGPPEVCYLGCLWKGVSLLGNCQATVTQMGSHPSYSLGSYSHTD